MARARVVASGGRLGFVFAALLILGAESPAVATFPGANGRIVVERYDADVNTTLFDFRPGVPGQRRLTRIARHCPKGDTYWSDEHPRYSPDGNWIAYVHEDDCRVATEFQRQIRVIRGDGSGMRIVRRFGEDSRAYDDAGLHPVFSRDGKRLAFLAGDARVWVVGAWSGRVVRRVRLRGAGLLISAPLDYWTFDWSPQGRIVITNKPRKPRGLRGVGLFASRLGVPLRRWTLAPQRRNSYAIDTGADWHPSGRSLIFERFKGCIRGVRCPVDRKSGAGDIFLSEGRGRVRRLTRGGFSGTPAFSPDGRSFVYQSGAEVCARRIGDRLDSWCVPRGARPSWQPVTGLTRPWPL